MEFIAFFRGTSLYKIDTDISVLPFPISYKSKGFSLKETAAVEEPLPESDEGFVIFRPSKWVSQPLLSSSLVDIPGARDSLASRPNSAPFCKRSSLWSSTFFFQWSYFYPSRDSSNRPFRQRRREASYL